MTIRTLIECDALRCDEEIVTDDGEFASDLIDRASASGWVTVKRADRLSNVCPECSAGILGG